MYCKKCKKYLPINHKYCWKCGAVLIPKQEKYIREQLNPHNTADVPYYVDSINLYLCDSKETNEQLNRKNTMKA